ncbi:MAG: HlyD family efflux transporter periplasmic adaptor subunit, partial [Pseudomonadota bacterium]
MLRILKTAVLILIVLGVAGLGYLFFAPQPVAVDLAAVDHGRLEVTVDEEGETQVREIYRISAPIAGKLERVDIEVGDRVLAGQRIARVRPVDPPIRDMRSRLEMSATTKAASAAVALAEAQVRQAGSDLKFARSDLSRAQTLADKGVISSRAREEAELNLSVKQAEVRKAEAGLELRRREFQSARMRELEPNQVQLQGAEDQCCIAITAPSSGVVLKVLTESEQVVQAGTTLLETGDPHDLEIIVDLLSSDAVGISPGTPARIEDWGGDGVLEAKVRRVDPAAFTKVSALGIEEQRVNVVLDFVSKPALWRDLGHAFKVTVRIITSDRDDVLRIPLGALFRRDQDWAVYIAHDSRAKLTPVKLGKFSLTHAEALAGAARGDQVVMFPSDKVSDN